MDFGICKGVLKPILYGYRGQIVVKFLASQKLYANFWLHQVGMDAGIPALFKSQLCIKEMQWEAVYNRTQSTIAESWKHGGMFM